MIFSLKQINSKRGGLLKSFKNFSRYFRSFRDEFPRQSL